MIKSLITLLTIFACLQSLFIPKAFASFNPQSQTSANNNNDFAPHQIIVKYKDNLTQPADELLNSQVPFASAMLKPDSSIDQLNKKYRVLSIKPVFDMAVPRGRKAVRAQMKGTQAVRQLQRDANAHWQASQQRALARAKRAPVNAKQASLHHIYNITLDPSVDEASAIKEFTTNPNVEYAVLNHKMQIQMVPNDPFYASKGTWGQQLGWGDYDDLWAVKKIHSEEAWDLTQGEGEIIAVIDTGVDYNHPDIRNNIWTNPNPGRIINGASGPEIPSYVNDVRGWNFLINTNDPLDDNGHGSHVAGIIAAEGNNAIGIIGVAPKAKIMPLKALDASGAGYSQQLAEAIYYAADHGATVIHNSWGCSTACPSDPVVEDAVRYAYSLGAIVVFAAGNSAVDVKDFSPQWMRLPITVSAFDQDDHRCAFSNYGSVDIAAPGCEGHIDSNLFMPIHNILSLLSQNNYMLPQLRVGGQYLRSAGTSMAAPFVSGAAALLLAKNPTWSIEQVRQALRRGAEDVDFPGFDPSSGHGRLNIANSMSIANPPELYISSPNTNNLDHSNIVSIKGVVRGEGLQQWTLAYRSQSSPENWITITSSQTPIEQEAEIAAWNISQLREGDYLLRLSANVDTSGGPLEFSDQRLYSISKIVVTPLENPIQEPGSLITIKGTIAPEGFNHYTVSIFENSRTNSILNPSIFLIQNGFSPIINDTLAVWDTRNVEPGKTYTITFTIYYAGRVVTRSISVSLNYKLVILNTSNGAGTLAVDIPQLGPSSCLAMPKGNDEESCEFAIPMKSIPITIRATPVDGALFKGWTADTGCTIIDGAACTLTFNNSTQIRAEFEAKTGPDVSGPAGTILINGGFGFTPFYVVLLTLNATDSVLGSGMGKGAQMQFSNDSNVWSEPEAYAMRKVWNLSSGIGTKVVYARFRDVAGNWSVPAMANIQVTDILPPTGTLMIEGGSSTTYSPKVTLSLSATDRETVMGRGSFMQFSNDFVPLTLPPGWFAPETGHWSAPEKYAVTKKWLLGSGYGPKHVCVRFSDSSGNWSKAYCRGITLMDNVPPKGSMTINSGALTSESLNVTLNLLASDAGSGMGRMRFSNDATTWTTPEAYATTKSWTLPGYGARTVYVQYRDLAGNWSAVAKAAIKAGDGRAPTGSFMIDNNAALTYLQKVTLYLTATDSQSGMGAGAMMQFSNDKSTWSKPEAYARVKSWKLSAGFGRKTVYVRFMDVGGEWSKVYDNDIVYRAKDARTR